jgi:hypothetical protein
MEDKQHKVPRYVELSWPGALTGAVIGFGVGAILSPGSALRNPPLLGGTVAAIAEVVHQRSFMLSVYGDEMFIAVLKGAAIFWAASQLGLNGTPMALAIESALVGGVKINIFDESK